MIDANANALIARVNKALGDNTFILASQLQIPRRFPSGSLGLDVILGGGWPGNQWIEILGKESAGKTALVLKTIAANQVLDPGFTALWVAAEHFDSDQALALGVDLERVIVAPTGQDMELAFTLMLESVESKCVDCTVLDSYPALLPEEEDEKSMSESTMAMGARLMGKFVRKAGKASRRAHDGSERAHLGIIINQFRDKIGGFSRFGTPQTSPGGNAKNYFFYTRLQVARDEFITEKRPGVKDPVTVGQSMKLKTVKNKSAAPQQTALVDFYFRAAPTLGFRRGEYDTAAEYASLGVLFKVIRKSGGWYYYGDFKWQGIDKVDAELRGDKGLREKLAAEVLELAANPKALDILEGTG